jgi:hypothetical protein
MTAFLRRNSSRMTPPASNRRARMASGGPWGWGGLAISVLAVILALTGIAGAAHKPKAHAVLRLDAHGKVPAAVLPKVAKAKNADRLGGEKPSAFNVQCNPESVDLGTWCLESAPYPLGPQDAGKNNYFFATQKCVSEGGYLPTAAQLIGAAGRVKLASTLTDNATTASIDQDATDGLKDRREMSATLVTVAAGASAAGSEGVSEGATGDPKQGEPNPTPLPANPQPDTLQYVTVYDNGDKGGFAGSQPVAAPQLFRCAWDKGAQGPQPDVGTGGQSSGGG